MCTNNNSDNGLVLGEKAPRLIEMIKNHPCPFDEYILQEEYVSDWVTIDAFDDTEVYEEVNEDYDEAEETMHSTQKSQHEEEPFDELIRNWALKTYQTHQALNGLLEILRKKTDYQLPKDARTLLKTRQCGKETYPIAGGEFRFPGVRSVLKDHFRDVPPRVSKFSLNFSIDGLPLHKSTRKQFWPILMSIQEMPEVPVLMVGNFFGESKPKSVEEYLRPLVDELNGLMDNGIVIANKPIEIHVRAFIADSPARAFIKGSVYFNHTHGCQKCTVQGRYHSAHRVTCFRGMDHPARTHEDFVQSNYGAHHRENTPLMDLKNFDIIKQIIIADRLHLFDYGPTEAVVLQYEQQQQHHKMLSPLLQPTATVALRWQRQHLWMLAPPFLPTATVVLWRVQHFLADEQ
uniref:uncharacterized protein LOC125908385 n=1 Tax=Anopheles coluzzii TaxID=1518534 RepID=UPI0020FF83C3|nr:uncharacterized protein LOC125908385 [Anopheles coluzzii]